MQLGMQQQQVQKLSQRLVMTPQMQQSVKLLQMNTIELEALAQQEMLENPFLEIETDEWADDHNGSEAPENGDSVALKEKASEDERDDDDYAADDYDTEPDRKPKTEEGADRQSEDADRRKSDDADDAEANAVEEQPEQFSEVDTDWGEVFDDTPNTMRNLAYGGDEEERNFEEIQAGGKSLYEHLMWQLRVSVLEGEDLGIGEYMVGCINEEGYFTAEMQECADHFNVEIERIEWILEIIQDFDPVGVGARDLPECLRLQLEAQDRLTPLAEKILTEHWKLAERKKIRELARVTESTEDEIHELYRHIARLDPAPGRSQTKEQPIYIRPDVYVRKMDGEYVILLNEGQVSNLRLNHVYKEILLGDAKNQDPKEREYAVDKYRSACALIKNIERRRNTVLRVTEAIMEHQRDFLEKGVEALHPLALSEIAEKVDLHESTISRVTSGKYVDTPRGLFELKFFFSSAIESDTGEAASSRAIKQKIREIIEGENPAKPYSDDKIAKMLMAQGFTIARRTVAKYREQLKILPTNLRRRQKN